MRIKTLICIALAALIVLPLLSCGEAKKTWVDPAIREDGKVYVERKLTLDFDSADMNNILALQNGNFMGIITKYDTATSESSLSIVVFDKAGKLVGTRKIDPQKIAGGYMEYAAGYDGKVYALEMRYEKAMPEPEAPDGEEVPGDKEKPEGEKPAPDEGPRPQPLSEGGEETKSEDKNAEGGEAQAEDKSADTDDAGAEKVAPAASAAPAAVPMPVPAPGTSSAAEEYVPETPEAYVHQFDETGELIGSVKLIMPETESAREFYASRVGVDEQGRIYCAANGRAILRFAANGTFEKSYEFENLNRFIMLPQNQAFITAYGDSGETASRISLDSGQTIFSLNGNNYMETMMYNPGDDAIYALSNSIVKRLDGGGVSKDVLYISDFSVRSPFYNIRDISIDKDESFYFIVGKSLTGYEQMAFELEQAKSGGTIPYPQTSSELIILELKDGASVPKKTEIVVSVMYQDQTIMQAASLFQSLHPDISVKVREIVPTDSIDSKEENAYENYIKKVNTEILTGKAADILALSGLPYQQYQDKNILLDLNGFIQKEPDFNDENYFMNIIKAYEVNGKQFVLPRSFYANYLRAKEDIGVPKEGFNLRQFIEYCDALPQDKGVMEYASPENMFYTLFLENINYFLDTRNKQARLDSQDFIDLLDACKRLGARGMQPPRGEEYDADAWEAYNKYIQENTVFQNSSIYDYRNQALSGVIIPLPTVSGPSTNFNAYELYGINRATQHKNECWEFLKFLFSEDYLKMTTFGSVTINKTVNKVVADYQIQYDELTREQGGEENIYRGGSMYSEKFERLPLTQAKVDETDAMIAKLNGAITYDNKLFEMMMEEVTDFLEGKKDAQTTAQALQSKMNIYLSE